MANLILQVNAFQRYIKCGSELKIIDDDYWNDTIGPALYPFWDSDKDKLIVFSYYDDGYFYIERKKYVKDFSKNEFIWKTYEWTEPSSEDVKGFVSTIKELLFQYNDVQQESVKQEIYRRYGQNTAVSWTGIKTIRKFLLDECDWVFLPDSNLSEEEKDMWKLYRQKLRDIPQDQGELLPNQVLFPIAPTAFKNAYLPFNPEATYLQNPDQYVTIDKASWSEFHKLVIDYVAARYLIKTNNIFDYAPEKLPNEATLEDMIKYIEDGTYIG